MMLHQAVAAGALLLWSVSAVARGPALAPAHGGLVVEDSVEHWVELVFAGDWLTTVYALDDSREPIPSTKLGEKLTALVAARSQA